eukprot:gene12605-biopygen2625
MLCCGGEVAAKWCHGLIFPTPTRHDVTANRGKVAAKRRQSDAKGGMAAKWRQGLATCRHGGMAAKRRQVRTLERAGLNARGSSTPPRAVQATTAQSVLQSHHWDPYVHSRSVHRALRIRNAWSEKGAASGIWGSGSRSCCGEPRGRFP